MILALTLLLAQTASEPVNGMARPLPDGRFEFYDARSAEWVFAHRFLFLQRSRRAPNEWPAATRLPASDAVALGDRFRLVNSGGGCDLTFTETGWQLSADVAGWDSRLTHMGACPAIREMLTTPPRGSADSVAASQ